MKFFSVKNLCVGSAAWMLLMTAIVFIPNISPWIAVPFVLVGIILVPGFLLALNLKIESDTLLSYLLYSGALGLSFLILGGLAINWALPYFGVAHPLAPLPLTIFFDLSVFVLALRAYLFNKNKDLPLPAIKPFSPNGTSTLFGIIPLAFLIMSVWGAEILNNGGHGTLTLVMLFAIAVYVLALMAYRTKMEGWVYVDALFCISLSLLLMYSLRSSHILGWDINQEYQVFQTTLQNFRWKMSYYPGLDYNACISITILPTIFKVLMNVPSEYIYKVIFQILFAITPIMVYALAKRYLKNELAFLAAFLLVSQTWFFEQMPALMRQEIAFIFYIAVLLALFDPRLTTRVRYILFTVFTAAIVLSHYSTAYIWITLLLMVLIFSYGSRLFIRSLRSQKTTIKPMMLVISLAFLILWQIPLTGTAGKVTNLATNNNLKNINPVSTSTTSGAAANPVARGFGAAMLVALAPIISPPGGAANTVQGALQTTLFAGGNQNSNKSILAAEKYATRSFGARAGYKVFSDATSSGYVPTTVSENTALPPRLPNFISAIIGFLSKADRLVFIDLFTIIGIVGTYIALRRRWRTSPDGMLHDFIMLNVAAYALIVLMLFIPYLQTYYNFTRLYLQMFLVLTILAVAGGMMATKYLPRYQVWILATMAVFMFCSLSGAFDQLTGGPARITLDQPPANLDPPYIYDAEVAGARWLSVDQGINFPVQADDVATLRLQSFGNIAAVNTAIFPETIERTSYVYLINANIAGGQTFFQYGGNLLVYKFPVDFLNNKKDLIYNAGASRIYH